MTISELIKHLQQFTHQDREIVFYNDKAGMMWFGNHSEGEPGACLILESAHGSSNSNEGKTHV